MHEGLRKGGVPEGAGDDLSRDDYLPFIEKYGSGYNVEGATKIDVLEAKSFVDGGDATFIDVRAALEFESGRIPGAKNLSLPTALSYENLSSTADKNGKIVFYCHGKYCPYSAYASARALAWGFTNVYYFAGGFPAWHDAGYDIESSEEL